jgi:hypothetical protein
VTPDSEIEDTSGSPDSPTRSLDDWAVIIAADVTTSIGGLIAAGQHLLEAQKEHPGTFVAWLKSKPFAMSSTQSYRLIKMAQTFGGFPKLGNLPPDRTSLYELSALKPAEILSAIEQGDITPEMDREEARALVVRLRGVKPRGDDSSVHGKDEPDAPKTGENTGTPELDVGGDDSDGDTSDTGAVDEESLEEESLDAEPATGKLTPGKLTPADRYTVTAGALDLLADSDRRLDPGRFVTHKDSHPSTLCKKARALRKWADQVEQQATTRMMAGRG